MLQPFADVVKLFLNQFTFTRAGTQRIYLAAPALALILALILPLVINEKRGGITWRLRYLFILIVLSLNIYPLILTGWSSNSKYAQLGRMRGIAQTISYEISLAFLLMSLFLINYSTSFAQSYESTFSGLRAGALPLIALWILTCVAELNRTPYDFAEGESELVSGFNIEYGRARFAVLFIAEYAIILTLRYITILFLRGRGGVDIFSVAGAILISRGVLWLRATLPRFRYDLLIELAWKTLLPARLGIVQISILINVINR